jgi:uncharacterized membrane protein YfcA
MKGEQALVYSLHRKQDHPQFLSTSRHIMQGMVDLSEVKWDAPTGAYSGMAKVTGGEPFVITLANNGHTPGKASATGGEVRLEAAGAGLTRLVLTSDENAAVSWSVTWKKAGTN